jgi:hypothetical protein
VVAVDLKTGKRLWKTNLQGLGPIAHTKYRNRVIIEVDDRRVTVYGNESSGRYVEQLDPRTGKTLANKKLEANRNP